METGKMSKTYSIVDFGTRDATGKCFTSLEVDDNSCTLQNKDKLYNFSVNDKDYCRCSLYLSFS
jgi:hypothetical protein